MCRGLLSRQVLEKGNGGWVYFVVSSRADSALQIEKNCWNDFAQGDVVLLWRYRIPCAHCFPRWPAQGCPVCDSMVGTEKNQTFCVEGCKFGHVCIGHTCDVGTCVVAKCAIV